MGASELRGAWYECNAGMMRHGLWTWALRIYWCYLARRILRYLCIASDASDLYRPYW